MLDSLVENLMDNVVATAKNKASPTVLLNDSHLVGFAQDQHPTRDQVMGLLGRHFQLNGTTYYVSHVGEPGQYRVRGVFVRFSSERPCSLSISRCKRGTCVHHEK